MVGNVGDAVPLDMMLPDTVINIDRPITVPISCSMGNADDDTICHAWHQNVSASQAPRASVFPQGHIQLAIAT